MNEWTKVKMQVANCYFVPLCRSALGFTTLLSYIVSALIAGTSTVALTLAQQTPRDMLNGSISPVTMNCRIFSVLPLFVCSFWTRNSNSEFWYLHLRWSYYVKWSDSIPNCDWLLHPWISRSWTNTEIQIEHSNTRSHPLVSSWTTLFGATGYISIPFADALSE